ncbi:hypothetical protein B0H13DRAFT_1880149 [Mycena leptocephala]|nr:hypothetical protein B0H13DRAFT_1880149 [Mycena leptocephala]
MASPILSSFEEQARCRLVVIMESEAEGRGSRKRALETAPEATYGGTWVYALSTPTLDSWYRDRRAVATSISVYLLGVSKAALIVSSIPAERCYLRIPEARNSRGRMPPSSLKLSIPTVPGSRFGVRARKASDVELRPTCYLPIINTFVHEVPEMKDSMPRYGETLCGGIRWMEAFGCGGIVLYSNTWIWATEYKKGAENSLHLAGHKWAVLSI